MASRNDAPPTPVREVLESGGGDRRRWTDALPEPGRLTTLPQRHPRLLAAMTAGVLLALTWSSAPTALRPLHAPDGARALWLAVLGGVRVVPAPEDGGLPGGLGAPAGTAVPGLRMAFMVEAGDHPVGVAPPPAGPVLRATPEDAPRRLDAGARTAVTLDVTPTDCTADTGSADAWVSLLGRDIEPRPDVVAGVARAMRILCAGAPAVTVTPESTVMPGAAATMRVSVSWTAPVDRVVVTPLDDDGSRGLGAVDLAAPGEATLLWRDADGRPAAARRVQVFAVVGGLAWPTVVTLRDE